MKSTCEGCQRELSADAEAYACTNECTFCADCASRERARCPHCGGELVCRPQHAQAPEDSEDKPGVPEMRMRMVWAISFGVWGLIAFAGTVTRYRFNRIRGWPASFG